MITPLLPQSCAVPDSFQLSLVGLSNQKSPQRRLTVPYLSYGILTGTASVKNTVCKATRQSYNELYVYF